MNVVTQIALPLSLAFIMFAMGLGLTAADFIRVVRQPKDFLVGATLQVIALPLVAFGLAVAWPLTPELSVGVMLLAACPGGTTSNLLTHLGRGDVALSISLTAVISVAGMVTVPFILDASLGFFMGADAPPLPIGKTVLGIFVITTVPVALGMAVRRISPDFADWAAPRSRPVVTAVFLLIVVAAVYSELDLLAAHLDATLLAVIALNLTMLVLAYGVARAAGLGPRPQVAVTMECGLQNATLAIVIAGSMLSDFRFGIPGALYGLWMLPTAAVVAWFTSRAQAQAVAAA